jgi:hypothetical protein
MNSFAVCTLLNSSLYPSDMLYDDVICITYFVEINSHHVDMTITKTGRFERAKSTWSVFIGQHSADALPKPLPWPSSSLYNTLSTRSTALHPNDGGSMREIQVSLGNCFDNLRQFLSPVGVIPGDLLV